ncbi:hypothetical protein G3I67_14450 [Orrella sp. NBD-18]|uniref:Helix-turn-helix domain-containing protein n=1 Tax=Sheuella amnicola TaxID=2707330 RepID=A0A6B2R0Y3_9BURK|nr:hypothetical protein [Sheuella amnicola]NDY84430.1 hypothetical protein [Sheuella amnicola]
MHAYLKAEIANLCKEASTSDKRSSQSPVYTYTPLRNQIIKLVSEMPPELRQRSWSITELAKQLNGRYKAHPHPQNIAKELMALGWQRTRVWTSEGRGSRIWHPPV